jgi:hypothetical protein
MTFYGIVMTGSICKGSPMMIARCERQRAPTAAWGVACPAFIRRQPALDPERLVFIDETSAATNMTRRLGRCVLSVNCSYQNLTNLPRYAAASRARYTARPKGPFPRRERTNTFSLFGPS